MPRPSTSASSRFLLRSPRGAGRPGWSGHELLNARAGGHFRRVDVAFRIAREIMQALKIAWLRAAISEAPNYRERPALDDDDLPVVEIGDVHEALFWIR